MWGDDLDPAHERTADGLSDATSAGGADDDLRGVFRNSERSDRIGDAVGDDLSIRGAEFHQECPLSLE